MKMCSRFRNERQAIETTGRFGDRLGPLIRTAMRSWCFGIADTEDVPRGAASVALADRVFGANRFAIRPGGTRKIRAQ